MLKTAEWKLKYNIKTLTVQKLLTGWVDRCINVFVVYLAWKMYFKHIIFH